MIQPQSSIEGARYVHPCNILHTRPCLHAAVYLCTGQALHWKLCCMMACRSCDNILSLFSVVQAVTNFDMRAMKKQPSHSDHMPTFSITANSSCSDQEKFGEAAQSSVWPACADTGNSAALPDQRTASPCKSTAVHAASDSPATPEPQAHQTRHTMQPCQATQQPMPQQCQESTEHEWGYGVRQLYSDTDFSDARDDFVMSMASLMGQVCKACSPGL